MIVRTDIPTEIQNVADTLESGGFEAHLVGGCVRDLLIGKEPKDWDITTNANPEEIIRLFEETYANNDYGTVGVVTESEDVRLKVVEVTPYRSESTYSDARRPDAVQFGVSLEEDLKRRDFTINAIAYRVTNERLIDPHNGQKDIEERRIVTVGEAEERFSEDALRILRAVRLAVELNFTIESDTMAAILKNSQYLSRISKERIRDEFVKIINSAAPMQGIVFLEKLTLLPHVLPELLEGIDIEQNQAHAYTVYEHLLRTLQYAADQNFPFHIRLAALLHDIGKPASRRWGDAKKDWTFHGHEVIGARMSRKILKDLRFSRETSEIVVRLVRWHMFFSDPDQITLSAVRRTIRNVGEEYIADLLSLRVCDRIGSGRPKAQPFRFRKYKSMVDEALKDPISVKMLKIKGERVIDITKEAPGPRLGDMLHALLEEVLDDPQKNTEEYLEKRTLELSTLSNEALSALGDAGKERQAKEEEEAVQALRKKHHVV